LSGEPLLNLFYYQKWMPGIKRASGLLSNFIFETGDVLFAVPVLFNVVQTVVLQLHELANRLEDLISNINTAKNVTEKIAFMIFCFER
jgi:hypothetical protein